MVYVHPFLERWTPWLARRLQMRWAAKVARSWDADGRPIPPPAEVKQRLLREYIRRFGLRRLVETGTYRGDTVAALAGDVDEVVSIELGEDLHRGALERLARHRNVTLLHGDSGKLLPEVAAASTSPTLFWLDAHWSRGDTALGDRETPVVAELDAVLPRVAAGDVILVDDVRVFGQPGWPTLGDLEAVVRNFDPALAFEVADDVVRIYDPRAKRKNPQA